MSTTTVDLLDWAITDEGAPSPALRRLASELLGRDVTGVEVIRRGSNLVLSDTDKTTVFRIQHVDRATEFEENLALVKELDEAGAPLVAAIPSKVAKDEEAVVTAWPMGRPADTGDQHALGSTLRALHDTPPPVRLRNVDVTTRFTDRLSSLDPGIPRAVVSTLAERVHEATQVLEDARGHGDFLLHGDAHIGNLVWLQGMARLIDLDDLCQGPREFDLAPSLVSHRRFHRDDRLWSDFRAGYGSGVDWELAGRLTVVREATMNTWLASLWAHSTAAQEELLHRVETWDTNWKDHEPWRPI